MRHIFTGIAYLAALVITATGASLAALYLVGPHGGVLPQSFYLPVIGICWIIVIVAPILFARWMWKRLRTTS